MKRTIHLLLMASAVLAASPEQPPEPPKAPVARLVQQVPPDLAEPILGRQVLGPGDKEVGRLVDVLIDATGEPQAAVIDFGGFMGVGNRRIAVRWDTLHFAPADPHRPIRLDMTLDEIKAAPSYNDTSKPAQVVTPDPAPPRAAETPAVADPQAAPPPKPPQP
jgi:hypothetical protein